MADSFTDSNSRSPPRKCDHRPDLERVFIPFYFGDSGDKPNPSRPHRSATATATATAAAARLQKVARGFLVRKNMRSVKKIEKEADDIEGRIRSEEDPVWREEKERLVLNEMLMRLLLRLDSVRGVRDYRKRVIRRVIALQEAMDSIFVAQPPIPEAQTLESKSEAQTVEEIGGLGEERNGTREAMEKMAAESARLCGLVAELVEKSEWQCRTMEGLVRRVEELERAVQRMEKAKRKHAIVDVD